MELYIHIPFCRKKCRYCSFASFPGMEERIGSYIALLLEEADQRRRDVTEPIDTVYIGGGTPSLIPADLFRKMTDGLRAKLPMDHVSEWTVEANPGTVTAEWIETAYSAGVNRISFGMQAYQPELLRLLGRIHRFEDVVHSVSIARNVGIHNINLDLMFGIPTQEPEQWLDTLEAALSLNPKHISAYGLIPEPDTPLYADLESGKYTMPDPDTERRMYDDAIRILAKHGLKQYEISNFSADGFECRHNIGYWTHIPYLGIGLSAASMTTPEIGTDGMKFQRRVNPSVPSLYIDQIKNGLDTSEYETVSPKQARFETMMLGLRMIRGISEEEFIRRHGVSPLQCYGTRLQNLRDSGLILFEDGRWRLSRRGFDIQNSILVEMMDDDT